MAEYIDGFVLPIPRHHVNEYKAATMEVAEIWKEHGALSYQEFIGQDLQLEGTRTFTDAMNANEDEVIVFGWVEFESRESRNLANKKVASDPRMKNLIDPLMESSRVIFDAKRMAYGGFQKFV